MEIGYETNINQTHPTDMQPFAANDPMYQRVQEIIARILRWVDSDDSALILPGRYATAMSSEHSHRSQGDGEPGVLFNNF